MATENNRNWCFLDFFDCYCCLPQAHFVSVLLSLAHTEALLCPLFSHWLFSVIWLPWRSIFQGSFRQEEVDIITWERWHCLFSTHISPTDSRLRHDLLGKNISETPRIYALYRYSHTLYTACSERAKWTAGDTGWADL